MSSQITINLLRCLFVVFTFFLGSWIGETYQAIFDGGILGVIFGLTIVLTDLLMKGVSLRLFSSATFGLLMGLAFARLLLASNVLAHAPNDLAWAISIAIYATSAYLATMLAIRSNREDFSLIIPFVRFQQRPAPEPPILIDTNIAIDGRIIEICKTGFLSRSLIVPRFVLNELHLLADSHDLLKRERGRRGLDVLKELQTQPGVHITIHEGDMHSKEPVDQKLLKFATLHQAKLLTNDENLCRIARLQGTPVLNLKDLSQSVRPPVFNGEELPLTLVKEGRESHQAIGYLDDGTMIVVNNAIRQIGKTVVVTILTTHQTSAGRLFFAELKQPAEATLPATAHTPQAASTPLRNLETPQPAP